jgi:hypothetical protein
MNFTSDSFAETLKAVLTEGKKIEDGQVEPSKTNPPRFMSSDEMKTSGGISAHDAVGNFKVKHADGSHSIVSASRVRGQHGYKNIHPNVAKQIEDHFSSLRK